MRLWRRPAPVEPRDDGVAAPPPNGESAAPSSPAPENSAPHEPTGAPLDHAVSGPPAQPSGPRLGWFWRHAVSPPNDAETPAPSVEPAPEADGQGRAADPDVTPAGGEVVTALSPPPAADRVPAEEDRGAGAEGNEPRSWFARLRAGLSRSSARLNEGINAIFNRRRLDDAALEELEELLISSDMGVGVAGEVVEALRRTRFNQEVTPEEVRAALAEQVVRLVEPVMRPLRIDRTRRPFVILVVGVNGSGKTTTIAKLARQYRDQGMTVMLAAGDTFRAAAVEQLAYDALVRARAEGTDLLLIDTAGRLHNKADLMGELQKIVRVVKKVDPEAPHSVLLVLDATTGQNAHAQAEIFREMVGVTGIVMTKLDGTARGGVLVSLAEKYGIPIHAIGIGETAQDLRPFEAQAYARSLVGLDP